MDATNTLFYWYQQNAAIAIQKLFHDLNGTSDGKETVNVLEATQKLELFAFEYAMTHLRETKALLFLKKTMVCQFYQWQFDRKAM